MRPFGRFILPLSIPALLATTSLGWAGQLDDLRRLAEQGDASAQFALGERYGNGDRVPQDSTLAARWIRKAAEQGHARAQFGRGILYSAGEGVREDRVEGLMWLELAAERGAPSAVEVRDELAARATPAQVAEARRRAADKNKTARWAEHPEQAYRRASEGDPDASWKQVLDAAERGDPYAQFTCGIILIAGNSATVPIDEVQGLMWLKLADRSGGEYQKS